MRFISPASGPIEAGQNMKTRWVMIPAVVLALAGAGHAQNVAALAQKSGCFECHSMDRPVVGPAFRDIAARYNKEVRAADVRFMSVAASNDLPEQRKSTVIVALVGGDLHVRIFDSDGNRIVDKSEAQLVKGQQLTDLKKQLKGERILDGSALSEKEKQAYLDRALAVAGYARARDALVEKVKKGGKGNWTAVSHGVPMPPFSGRLTDAEIRSLVDWVLHPTAAVPLKVMRTGLGSGTITSNPPGINCGTTCDAAYGSGVTVTLTATPDAGSVFVRWEGDSSGTTSPVTVTMSASRSVRAVFDLTPAIPALADLTPTGIQTYLAANPTVNSAGRFINALPQDFKRNWILMSRSESLQTGTAEFPRLLLPSANAQAVFTTALSMHVSYPGAHPSAMEYMQWDAAEKSFRFHEIVLDAIPAMGNFPARVRGISIDDAKCSKCHSTRNVLNRSSFPGTTGLPPGTLKAKNKPNWDSYDSWGGMMPFNRDRIYQGSVEAAAFRQILNLWTWRSNDAVRSVIEQLELQPPNVPAAHVITRTSGGADDGHINFGFDASPPVLTEPAPTGSDPSITTNYAFDGIAGTGVASSVVRGGSFVTLHHSVDTTNDEGRGVHFFDSLGGLAGNLNPQRIADELIDHRFATGSVPIDVRPVALAITKGLLRINATTNAVESTPPLTINLAFFDARNGMRINDVLADTRMRKQILPRRKADIQKINLDRSSDVYLSTAAGGAANGLVQQYGPLTFPGTDTSLTRLRQDVFRRTVSPFPADSTVMGGIYVDREIYGTDLEKVALYRYFLEPLGVSVDKWSMGVRGRSRTYTFADVFGTYLNFFQPALKGDLLSRPVPGLSNPDDDGQLIGAVNSTLATLPAPDAVPTYTDIQRIFNKSCIECHGGLGYPPYQNYGTFLDLSEDEAPPAGSARLDRANARAMSYTTADPATSLLYQKITATSESCPFGLMPCGGPALSRVDIETIRRWIVGGRPATAGDPHIHTVDGVDYDFQAAGEFVFLRGENLEIQVRHTAVDTAVPLGPNPHTGLTSCVSVNSAVALRVGRQRITYEPNLSGKPDPEGLQLRIDGQLRSMTAQGIPLASGGRVMPTIAPGGLQIEAPGGTVVVITPGWWDHYQVWYLNIDVQHARATQGLMGAIAPGNWLPALPDGSLLGPRPQTLSQRYKDLYDNFGKAWRVNDQTTLFDYAPGTSTKTFTLEKWPGDDPSGGCKVPLPPGAPPAKPPQEPLGSEVAKQLTRDIVDPAQRANAIADVMTTGERGFAKTYLLADQIKRNRPPTAPVLLFPDDNKTGLAEDVTLTWKKSTDPDGDPITYRYYVWPVEGEPNTNDAVPITLAEVNANPNTLSKAVSKLKSGKSYFWKVIAEDNKGGTVESETRRFEIR
jgi:cytochrome c551/c552